jgi:hypothetical protein
MGKCKHKKIAPKMMNATIPKRETGRPASEKPEITRQTLETFQRKHPSMHIGKVFSIVFI